MDRTPFRPGEPTSHEARRQSALRKAGETSFKLAAAKRNKLKQLTGTEVRAHERTDHATGKRYSVKAYKRRST